MNIWYCFEMQLDLIVFLNCLYSCVSSWKRDTVLRWDRLSECHPWVVSPDLSTLQCVPTSSGGDRHAVCPLYKKKPWTGKSKWTNQLLMKFELFYMTLHLLESDYNIYIYISEYWHIWHTISRIYYKISNFVEKMHCACVHVQNS